MKEEDIRVGMILDDLGNKYLVTAKTHDTMELSPKSGTRYSYTLKDLDSFIRCSKIYACPRHSDIRMLDWPNSRLRDDR